MHAVSIIIKHNKKDAKQASFLLCFDLLRISVLRLAAAALYELRKGSDGFFFVLALGAYLYAFPADNARRKQRNDRFCVNRLFTGKQAYVALKELCRLDECRSGTRVKSGFIYNGNLSFFHLILHAFNSVRQCVRSV